MNGYTGTIAPRGIYVKALYNYNADDQTSLSFYEGDIIQVLTQLESGWWDGVVHGHRGWFPSNYCEFVSDQQAEQLDQSFGTESDTADEDATDDDYDDDTRDTTDAHAAAARQSLARGGGDNDQEAAAFWIPQATPEGRLYYFNTLTGVSTTELPLESPTSEFPTQRRHHVLATASSRTPAEQMANGYERDDDTDADQSASEAEAPQTRTRASQMTARQRASYISDGASPATSMESLNDMTGASKPRSGTNPDSMASSFASIHSTGKRINSLKGHVGIAIAINQTFLDESHAVKLTWPRLVEDMRRSVDRYRQVVIARDRAEFVRRAEDISDHLRLLLAAGSGTTDNHSGMPSIIATNKALYPHFRDMMSKFSKLVLSSHIAAADFAGSENVAKCLQEADGVLKGVYGFVDVARRQRGESIPRLLPGFVTGSMTGGSWQNNGLSSQDAARDTSFIDNDEYEPFVEPNIQLDASVLERMNDLKRLIVSGLRRLEERLVIQDKIITQQKHKKMGNEICSLCAKVVELYRPWMTSMESIDLSGTGLTLQDATVNDFAQQKQRVYVYLAELVVSCQSVTAPLADEWDSNRGETLEERIHRVRKVSQNLETSTSTVQGILQQFHMTYGRKTVLMSPTTPSLPRTSSSQASTIVGSHKQSNSSISTAKTSRSILSELSASVPPPESSDAAGLYANANNPKANKFFGETPLVREVTNTMATPENMPDFLGLDFEGEVQYDPKTDPPLIRGGTLTGLVEQLTRHDRYDAPFKTTFLLTYQSFTNATELFEALILRWSIQPPNGLTQEEYKLWVERKQAPIRFRIVNVLKSWIDTYWMEGDDPISRDLLANIYSFAKETVANSGTAGWKPLLNVIDQRMRGEDTQAKKLVPNPNSQTPMPILPKNMKKLKFGEIDPTEFARQLTIIESRLYGKIKPPECLNKIWQKKPAGSNGSDVEPAANVKALILHSNRLTNWVAEMILAHGEQKKRVNVIKHFVAVADKCLAMNNFSTLTSIISALGTAPIHRLARTWSSVPKNTQATLEKMRRMMASSKNFATYRSALHQANPPCIPFFGVYLTDLTFIEDGMSGNVKKTDLINFSKRAKTAEVIREIQTYQNVSYPFKAVPELQDYILSMMQSAGDVHEMYDRSLQVEPREREDEKIARYAISETFGGLPSKQQRTDVV